LFFACGEANNATNVKSQTSEKKSNKPTSKSCLEEFVMNPCDLVSQDEIAGFLGVEAAQLTKELPLERFKKSEMRSCRFKWDTGRKMQIDVAGSKMEVPLDNSVLFGSFQVLDANDSKVEPPYLEWFKNAHRSLTAKEEDQLEKQVDKSLAKSDQNTSSKENAKQIIKSATKYVNKSEYRSIAGVGDHAIAVINPKTTQIMFYVLHQNITFTVVAEATDDKEEGVQIAKNIAKAILGHCD